MEALLDRFFKGDCYDAYTYFGAHKNGEGYIFRVFAPNAVEVRVVGDFNFWDGADHIMNKIDARGIYELSIPSINNNYFLYKYKIKTRKGQWISKADPFAFFSELRPNSASKTFDLTYNFDDSNWMSQRNKCFDSPLNIYEMHLGSWKQHEDGSFYSYEEIAPEIVAYCKENHFTHVEFLPLLENPLDLSWGYLVSSFFAITSRYGNPLQFKRLVEILHQNNIGVIMDFVPVHFITDDFSLGKFDGGHVYESNDKKRRLSQWGSYLFDYSKPHVMSFVTSSLYFLISEYHLDGIRFDAISNMIFYNGNKNEGINEANINWLKKNNSLLSLKFPNVMLIAEDSSDYQGVTKPTFENGLGFDYKWDLGWMNDTLKYLKVDPYFRGENINLINFSMYYFYSERFILPFSHDEVVHMKGSIINKITGSYEQKFQQVRTLYTYMFTHPGKKLNFMGNELALFDEWIETNPIYFQIKKYPMHDSFARFFKDLSTLYTTQKCLYKQEYDPSSFQWISCSDKNNVFIYERHYKSSNIIVVLNFSSIQFEHYKFKVSGSNTGHYEEILNTDSSIYSGYNFVNDYDIGINSFNEIGIKIPSFGAVVLKYKK